MATAPSGNSPEPTLARDPALGLWNQWYAVSPVGRLSNEREVFRVAGREVALTRGAEGRILAEEGTILEQDAYVWLFVGDGEPNGRPAPLGLFHRQGYAFSQRTVRVRADYRWVLENSLDFSHGAIAHPFTQPSWLLKHLKGLPPLEATYRPTPEGLEVVGKLGKLTVFHHSFMLPDRLRLVILPGTPFEVEIVVLHVPEDRRSCRMEVALARRALPWEGRTPRFVHGSLLVHRQDVVIVEAQQAALDAGPAIGERHCEADAYTLLMRRVLAAAADGGWDPGPGESRSIRMRVS